MVRSILTINLLSVLMLHVSAESSNPKCAHNQNLDHKVITQAPNDAHIADDPNANCSKSALIHSNDFETSLGIWIDGGSDCHLGTYSGYDNSRSQCVRLRDNSSTRSSLYTTELNFSPYSEVIVHFTYKPNFTKPGEDFFLELSQDGGESFSTVQRWRSDRDFENGIKRFESVSLTSGLSSNNVIRFRCDASTNSDEIFLDDISIETCGGRVENLKAQEVLIVNDRNLSPYEEEKDITVQLYPNPATTQLTLELGGYANEKISEVEIMSSFGKVFKICDYLNLKSETLDISELAPSQSYLLMITTSSGEILIEKFSKQ